MGTTERPVKRMVPTKIILLFFLENFKSFSLCPQERASSLALGNNNNTMSAIDQSFLNLKWRNLGVLLSDRKRRD